MYKKILPVFLLIVLATTLASAGLNPFAKNEIGEDLIVRVDRARSQRAR